jgi:hypothetical protein
LTKRKQNSLFFGDIVEEDGNSVLDKLIEEVRRPKPVGPKTKKPTVITLADTMFATATPKAIKIKPS